jgi:hypothetical protein
MGFPAQGGLPAYRSALPAKAIAPAELAHTAPTVALSQPFW